MGDRPTALNEAVSGTTATDAERTFPAYPIWKDVLPYPPLQLMLTTGAKTLENFLVVGDAWFQMITRSLVPDAQVMDIGCGCGRTARFLAQNPWVRRYVGFDVVPESVAWCNRFLAPHTGDRFRFLHFDIQSDEYNPGGAIRAEGFRLPAEDRSTDLVFASSLFTHLFEPAALQYLRETRRILSRRGVAIFSIHIDTTAEQPFRGTEARIDIHPPYWAEMARRCGLAVREHYGELCGQDTWLFELSAG